MPPSDNGMMPLMNSNTTSQQTRDALRKAAVLVSTLDTHTADALLSKMGPEQAARVRSAAMQLGDVDANEQRLVLDEFMRAGNGPPHNKDPGIELDDSLAQKIATRQSNHPRHEAAEATEPEAVPFRFLHETTADSLAKHLGGEHPQLIAVVAFHLPPKRAADLVMRLPAGQQANVLRRVAELDSADPQVLLDVERELKLLLSDDIRAARNRSAGLTAVTSILNAAGTDRAELLKNVVRHDQLLAAELGEAAHNRTENKRSVATATPKSEPGNSTPLPSTVATPVTEPTPVDVDQKTGVASKVTDELPPVTFETLLELDDPSLAVLIRAANPQVILLALVGADPKLLDRILRQLAPREARLLRRKLERTGPLRLTDVARAQQQVARTAAELAAQGQLSLPAPKRFAIAA